MNFAVEVARQLLQIKAIQLNPQNPFQWASGLYSPIYCDNRKSLSYPSARDLIKTALVDKSQFFEPFAVVAGVATAGIPHGVLLADALNLPFIYVRDKAKGHGLQNLIEGELQAGQRVLVVEDLISTGGSSLKAVESIRASGGTVVGVLAIFSYDFQQAVQNFERAACPLATLSNYETLIEQALDMSYIEASTQATLLEWRQNPTEWSDRF